jgi:hypothetical protein
MMSRDRVIAIALGLAVLTTRIPFATHVLFEWDSVLYARALEQGFHVSADLADQRPHPPGYIFYLAAGAILRAIFGDSNTALVALSILASAGATAAVYLLARRFARAELAAFAALAFAASPLVWAQGEVAMPYLVLALGATGLALLFWDARRGDRARFLVASVVFGLAAGLRQDLLLVLGPLWLWTAARQGPRGLVLGAIAVAAGCLGWLVPSAVLSGGLDVYLGAVAAQSRSITGGSVASPGGGGAFLYNLRFTLLALGWGLFATALLLAALLLVPALHWARHPRPIRPGERGAFFLLWIAPGLAIYLAWIIGEWGYVFSILPALYILCAALVERALGPARGPGIYAWRALATVVIAAGALAFLIVPGRWSQATLAKHDQDIGGRVAYIRANFPPARTIVLAREDHQHVRYYLTEYRAWRYDPAPARATDPKKDLGGSVLVVFTPELQLRQSVPLSAVGIGGSWLLTYVPAPATAVQLFGVDDIAREP